MKLESSCKDLKDSLLAASVVLCVLERMELESKLQEWERRKIDEEARVHAEREKAEDRLNAAKEAKESAEKEVLVLRCVIKV